MVIGGSAAGVVGQTCFGVTPGSGTTGPVVKVSIPCMGHRALHRVLCMVLHQVLQQVLCMVLHQVLPRALNPAGSMMV